MSKNNIKDIDSAVYHNVDDLFEVIGTSEEEIEKLHAAPYSYWRETFKQLLRKPLVIICLAMIVILVALAIFGPIVSPYSIVFNEAKGQDIDVFDYNLPWSAEHWFGTGGSQGGYFKGLDLWTCVWVGTRLSLVLGTVVALIDTILGILIGSIWGYFRRIDPIMIEIRNFVNNIPSILLYFLLMQFLSPSFWTIVLVLCMFGWLGLAGFIRNQIIIIRNREYNVASLTLGSKPSAMITHNLLPYLVSVIVTVVSTAIPAAISSEVGLAFFGLSFNPVNGDITLGQLLTDVTSKGEWLDHPNLLVVPLIVMIPLTISFYYVGLALADATDPKNHR